MKDSLRKCSKI